MAGNDAAPNLAFVAYLHKSVQSGKSRPNKLACDHIHLKHDFFDDAGSADHGSFNAKYQHML